MNGIIIMVFFIVFKKNYEQNLKPESKKISNW